LVVTLGRSIFDQPDAKEVVAQHGQVVEQQEKRLNGAAEDILANTSFPSPCWWARS
jgi:hypothetical protein